MAERVPQSTGPSNEKKRVQTVQKASRPTKSRLASEARNGTERTEADLRVIRGDWQTPETLASEIVHLIHHWIEPRLVLEPNCGLGAFLKAARNEFSRTCEFWGADLNPQYAESARTTLGMPIFTEDFFAGKWRERLNAQTGEILLLGNPPWVTNSEMKRRAGSNLPPKSNQEHWRGIEAVTGKSNFDISQTMLLEEMEAMQRKNGLLAMLCKTAAARRVLEFAWKKKLAFTFAQIRKIDSRKHFGIAVDAALFVLKFNPKTDRTDTECSVFGSLNPEEKPSESWGMRRGQLVRDSAAMDRLAHLLELESASDPSSAEIPLRWRSGIKHDCTKVMELRYVSPNLYRNGLGEEIELEEELLYPFLKSSDTANGRVSEIQRRLLLTQFHVGQELPLEKEFPKIWAYLNRHADLFSKRKSGIYRGKGKFALFGVGDYSFMPWKIAISSLYKTWRFQLVGPFEGKPVLFDDTCCFLALPDPRKGELQACFLAELLQSDVLQELLSALIFPDAKRPVTCALLNQISLPALAKTLGKEKRFQKLFG